MHEVLTANPPRHGASVSADARPVRVEGKLAWLDSADADIWDAFVARHPNGSIYHLSLWQRAIERSFAHMHADYLVLWDPISTQILAGMPIYTVRSWLLGNRLVSVPFASFCDPLLSSEEDWGRFLPAVWAMMSRERAQAFEIRPWQTSGKPRSPDFCPGSLYKHHYLRLDRPLDEIKKSCSRTCVRQWLGKAERNGITVVSEPADTVLANFHALATETRRRHSLPPIPFRLFESLRDVLGPTHCGVRCACHEGRSVSAVLFLRFRNTFTLEYAGDSEEGRATGASQFLYWSAIQEALQLGCVVFSFGRTALDNVGLLDYKRRWGTVEEDLPVLFLPRRRRPRVTFAQRRNLHQLARYFCAHAPDRVYWWLGDFCYRHWG